MTKIELSQLSHTWFIDVDGTIVKHNGHLSGEDDLLPGVLEFWQSLPEDDTIILLSARKVHECSEVLENLRRHGLRFDHALFDLPTGERVLINDKKPKGLSTAVAVNVERDAGLAGLEMRINGEL